MNRPIFSLFTLLLACLANVHTLSAGADAASTRPGPVAIELKADDVVAFIGGETAVAQARNGHLELLLTAAYPTEHLRFRSLAWEGDTVFEQPRDVNFPNLYDQLAAAHATVIVAQFGRNEALSGSGNLPGFIAAYEAMCDRLGKIIPRVALVTPIPFEKPVDPAQLDLVSRNGDLKLYAQAVVALAAGRRLPCVDLFSALIDHPPTSRLTGDGMRLTPAGSGVVALAMARSIGLDSVANRAGNPLADGKWPDAPAEALREAIVEKNKLWFDYARPTNWAFLGGDRMHVLSSRDADNPNHRWFPEEMQQYLPLVAQAEQRIDKLAPAAGK